MARINRDSVDKWLDHGIDLDSKTLYLGYGEDDEIDLDKSLTREVLKGLHILSRVKPDTPLTILLNCQGGDTLGGLAIYDAICALPCEVDIEVVGRAYSMAAWILQAGTVRRMHKHSALMIHKGEDEHSGSPDVVKNWVRFYQAIDIILADILLARLREKDPSFPRSRLEKMLRTDTILTAQQALELGLIDEIIGEE